MEWLKANKWYAIAALVVLAVLFGMGGDFIPTDK